jgi:DNA-3-methyladenine glycosylase I
MSETTPGPDGKPRCRWSIATPDYVHYHDTEWGYPVDDDRRLFEKLCLEGFQAGLSWRTILAKRENFRAAFKGFDFDEVARFGFADVERLLQDAGIVRHRGKIEAVINNARRAQALVKPQTVSTIPAAIALSKALKARGWAFVGPTTMYAFMQAMGLVNDHAEGCTIREEVERARVACGRPKVA